MRLKGDFSLIDFEDKNISFEFWVSPKTKSRSMVYVCSSLGSFLAQTAETWRVEAVVAAALTPDP